MGDPAREDRWFQRATEATARLRDAEAREKRYREALEAIASAKCGDNRKNCHHMGEICRAIARRALTSPVDLGGPTPGEVKKEPR